MLGKVFAGLVGVTLLAVAGSANAGLINSSADPALAGATLIDFNSTATQNAASFSFGAVTFAANSGSLSVVPGASIGGTLGSGQGLGTGAVSFSPLGLSNIATGFSINFATTVTAFGMLWEGINLSWTIGLFDASNALLETLTIAGGADGFHGATNIGIAKAVLSAVPVGSTDFVLLDNFVYVPTPPPPPPPTTGIPEPGSLALFGLGLLGLGLAARRRRKAA